MSKIKHPVPCRIVQYHPAGLKIFMPALVVWNDKTVINAAVFMNGSDTEDNASIRFRRNIPHQIDAKEGEHYWTWPKRDDVKPITYSEKDLVEFMKGNEKATQEIVKEFHEGKSQRKRIPVKPKE